ncbi:MAG: serine/threonine protein kinase [Bdellovibrionales bacterium]|nr:serine/threonine protein kinase [Bdellovibrionales bacterium]
MWTRSITFELQDLLGEGSQGRVFKALRADKSSGLTQAVAVKILHSKTAVDLWKKEFESLARVRSPYCVQVLSFERIEGQPALILELVEGVSLSDLGRTCLLTPEMIDEIVAQVQAGLEDLRNHGTFHGDLSPNNVMIDEQGRVRLLDFGLANGEHRLTPDFAAPERLNGSAGNFQADLFSLGRIEQFLRGVKLSSVQPSPFLFSVATLRQPRDLKPQAAMQTKLSAIVRQLRERRRFRLNTRTLGPTLATRPSKGWMLAVLISFCVLTTSGASQVVQLPCGFLTLRTENWHYFLVDGVPVGYSPLTLALKAGEIHQIEWVSAQGRGRKRTKLKRDQHVLWSDRDFSH